MFCERAFCPFDVLCAWLTILFGQIAQECSQGLASFMLRQGLGNVTRHGIRSAGTHFPVDPGELMRGQTDGDLRSGHTSIIPRVSKYRKLPPLRRRRSSYRGTLISISPRLSLRVTRSEHSSYSSEAHSVRDRETPVAGGSYESPTIRPGPGTKHHSASIRHNRLLLKARRARP